MSTKSPTPDFAAGAARVSEDGSRLLPGDVSPSYGTLTTPEAGVAGCLPLFNTPEALRSAQAAVENRYAAEADRLRDDGLLMAIDQQLKCVFVALVPIALVAAFLGLPRLVLGVLADRPVGYLVATLLVGGYFAAILSMVGDLRVVPSHAWRVVPRWSPTGNEKLCYLVSGLT